MGLGRYKANIIMWVIYPVGLTVFILFMFLTCSGIEPQKKLDDPVKKREFTMISIPQDITEPRERADYLVSHYWDNFDFSDTAYIHLPAITEQAFVNYIGILPHAGKDISYSSIDQMLIKAQDKSPEVYNYFVNIYKKYLYDPNSPLRNEEFYIPVLNQVVKSANTSDTDKQKAEYTLSLLLKNRIGNVATDVTYTLASGKSDRLHNIKSKLTLLYFHNPDCHACEEVSQYMKQSQVITEVTGSGLLKVLAFYPDKDLDIWKKHQKDIPDTWINGYDKSGIVSDKQIYDLKAIPTLYLLDENKKVILKDADITAVESYIKDNNSILFSN